MSVQWQDHIHKLYHAVSTSYYRNTLRKMKYVLNTVFHSINFTQSAIAVTLTLVIMVVCAR